MFDETPLRRSIESLSSFFVGDATIVDTLQRVAELATKAVPVSKFVGLTMMVDNKPTTAVFTDEESPEIDQAQYSSGRGPCIDAFASGEIREIPSTRQANPWPEFSRACLEHGILATLSLPMSIAGNPLGAMNMYAEQENVFNGTEIETATLFASQSSIVLANSQAYWDARALSEQLSESITSRAVIEQAKGIIMGSMRCDADQAFEYLVQQSQQTNTKLRTVAEAIVRDVTRRGNGDRD
jgi:GAF domain-containing protein